MQSPPGQGRSNSNSASTAPAPAQDVVVIGGGLAGMTVALELAKAFERANRAVRIRILERGGRVGGKAGADLNRRLHVAEGGGKTEVARRYMEDHGFHIFPAWYVNTRQLLDEIGCAGNLIDIDRFHHLSRGEFPRFITLKQWSNLPNVIDNALSGLAPLPEAILSFFFLLELAAQPFSRRAYLDRVSAAGFLRSRFYALDSIARLHHQGSLQASSIPYYEISAMSMQKMVRGWLRKPAPFVSILNDNLQAAFIEPFRRVLTERHGVEILTGHNVVRLRVAAAANGNGSATRIGGVLVLDERGAQQIKAEQPAADGSRLEKSFHSASALIDCGPQSIYVLTVPIDEALELVDDEVYAAEAALFGAARPADASDDRHGLADLIQLHSAPMAAFHVHFRRRLPGVPREHITLSNSEFGLTLVDVSQHWPDLPHTTLNGIASYYLPLVNLEMRTAKLLLLRDLLAYIPFTPDDLGFDCRRDDLDEEALTELDRRCYLAAHEREPLFLNTVGAWHYRPDGGTGFANLFVAGDYCRSNADLTTMESAVGSAYRTSAKILAALGLAATTRELPIPEPPRLLLNALRWATLPLIVPVAAWCKVRERRSRLAAGAAAD